MKERPILFSGPMVRAILDGRKTQTRRVVKPQPVLRQRSGMEPVWDWAARKGVLYTSQNVRWLPFTKAFEDFIEGGYCPYGQPGDRLWVRETFAFTTDVNETGKPDRFHLDFEKVAPQDLNMSAHYVIYRADGETEWADDDGFRTEQSFWKPSIHMPRWASRISLEVVKVRVERLHDITDNDAIAEGLYHNGSSWSYLEGGKDEVWSAPRQCYKRLWEKINGLESWKQNPWVWVVEFKRL